jgi:hypothetical protein
MKYNPPYGVSDPNAGYVNGDPSVGRAGSIPPAESIEYPQREIVSVIADVGLSSPNNNDLAQMSAATRFMRPQLVGDVGTANHIKITLAPTTPVWQVPLTFFVVIGANNTNTSQTVDVEITGITTKRPLVKRTGQPVAIGDLIAGSIYLMTYDGALVRSVGILNSEFTLPPASGLVVDVFAGNRDYYINPASGNDANDGKTAGTAWHTLQYAYNWVQSRVDLAGYTVTFHCADGTYPAGVSCVGFMRGQTGGGAVIFQGNNSAPQNCLVSIPSGVCFACYSGAKITINGFMVQVTGNYSNGIVASGSGSEITLGPMNYGQVGPSSGNASNQIGASGGGHIDMVANYTISGGSAAHIVAAANGSIFCNGLYITINNNPLFQICFVDAQTNGSLYLNDTLNHYNTYAGTVQGQRYQAVANGVIFTYNAGPNYLPGTIGGAVGTGGQYV